MVFAERPVGFADDARGVPAGGSGIGCRVQSDSYRLSRFSSDSATSCHLRSRRFPAATRCFRDRRRTLCPCCRTSGRPRQGRAHFKQCRRGDVGKVARAASNIGASALPKSAMAMRGQHKRATERALQNALRPLAGLGPAQPRHTQSPQQPSLLRTPSTTCAASISRSQACALCRARRRRARRPRSTPASRSRRAILDPNLESSEPPPVSTIPLSTMSAAEFRRRRLDRHLTASMDRTYRFGQRFGYLPHASEISVRDAFLKVANP